MIFILFGLAGAGKTYIGKLLQKTYGYYFLEGDELLTPAMHNCIQQKLSFTDNMRDEFTKIIIKKLAILKAEHTNIVLSQALYKLKNRIEIQYEVGDCLFIQVIAMKEKLKNRLFIRNSETTCEYAAIIDKNFEPTQDDSLVLLNDTDDSSILHQWEELVKPSISKKQK